MKDFETKYNKNESNSMLMTNLSMNKCLMIKYIFRKV